MRIESKKSGRWALILLTLLATAGVATAQGVITDGDVTFEYTAFDLPGGAFADLEVDTGTDHMFGQWWYYRLAGDLAETVFPAPDTQDYSGNVATLTWADVNGLGLSAVEVVTVSDSGDIAGGARHDLTLTNNGAMPLSITLFNYTDLDVDASAGNDSATDLTATHLGVIETAVASYRGLGADAFQVLAWPELRDLLEDGLTTDLDNSGTPFGPADFTGGFQWNVATIPAGASVTYSAVHNVNDASAPLELAFSGSCPGTVQLRVDGATPGGNVAIAGGPSLGSFTIPGGGCSGTELDLDSPRLLSNRPADANGAITLDLNLPSTACGQVVQAIDLSSCAATNTDLVP